jgi:DNA recombination protein RmuC
MEILTIVLLLILIIAVFTSIFLLLRKKDGGDNEKAAVMLDRLGQLAEQNKDLRQSLDTKLSETHRANQVQFGQTAKIISEVTEKLTKLDETNKQVINFSAQLQNLQDILKNPKQRGVLGEYFLEEILRNVLPPNSYQMQYNMGKDEHSEKDLIVDAVVFVKDKIIPIDSKFSLENYNRLVEEKNETEHLRLEKLFVNDLKLRIQETAKYIKPQKNTMDFAFMFIPHEAIYYDLLVNKVGALQEDDTNNLIQRAASKYHVIIISPTSFLAYLQTVLQGLKAMQIEENAKEIRANVEKLSKHIFSFETFFKKIGNSMSTTVNHYNVAYNELAKIDKDVVKIAGGEAKVDPIVIDKPKSE